jgi:hypothetical protein
MHEKPSVSKFYETRKRAQEHPLQGSVALVAYIVGSPIFMTSAALEEESLLKGVAEYFKALGGTAVGLAEWLTDDVHKGYRSPERDHEPSAK